MFGSPTMLAAIGGKLAVIVATLVGAWEDAILRCFFSLDFILELC